MDQPGVSVKPIHKMTGESGFNEVFLDNAIVEDNLRVGNVGDGWKVAMATSDQRARRWRWRRRCGQ